MDANSCPTCGRPYGKRRRCYYCQIGRRRSGQTMVCKTCGNDFYAPKWADNATYCSRACKAEGQRGIKWGKREPGKRYQRGDGYISIYAPNHPKASKSGSVMEHRLVMEQAIGRYLEASEHVHHINGVRNDNRLENLEVISAGPHALISIAAGIQKRAEMRDELIRLRAEVAEYRQRYGPLSKGVPTCQLS